MTRSGINLAAAGGVDLKRLERGLALRLERVGSGQYHVSGGSQAHWVDLYHAAHPRCDCGDHLWRDRVCKHILAAMLREGDERVLHAVAELVSQLRSGASPRRAA
ncbi:MAG TPA: hypothetical protein VFK09_12850 [Gemmatimonadales bacterium]|jgi:hypothetical protein|nr:hypothetical protein [Gemmatimonadales bacterium]